VHLILGIEFPAVVLIHIATFDQVLQDVRKNVKRKAPCPGRRLCDDSRKQDCPVHLRERWRLIAGTQTFREHV
jgi:hypothetical protein